MTPEAVVVDTQDGYVVAADKNGVPFTIASASSLAAEANAMRKPEFQTYEVFKLVPVETKYGLIMYKVTKKYTAPDARVTDGEHYTIVNPDEKVSAFQEISFYRSSKGREVATDYIGRPLLSDGDLFRLAKEAVERYDQENAR